MTAARPPDRHRVGAEPHGIDPRTITPTAQADPLDTLTGAPRAAPHRAQPSAEESQTGQALVAKPVQHPPDQPGLSGSRHTVVVCQCHGADGAPLAPASRAQQDAPHGTVQRRHGQWLDQIATATHHGRTQQVGNARARAEHHDRHIGAGGALEATHHLQPAAIGLLRIDDDQIVVAHRQHITGLLQRSHAIHVHAQLPHAHSHMTATGGAGIHHQDAQGRVDRHPLTGGQQAAGRERVAVDGMLLCTGHQHIGRAVEHGQDVLSKGGKQQIVCAAQTVGPASHADDRNGARQAAQPAGRIHAARNGEIDQRNVELPARAGIGQLVAVRVLGLALEDQLDQTHETLAQAECCDTERQTRRFGNHCRRCCRALLATRVERRLPHGSDETRKSAKGQPDN